MASNVETAAPRRRQRARPARRRPRVGSGSDDLGLLLARRCIVLVVFFLAPLCYIFVFSTGLRYFAARSRRWRSSTAS